MIFLSADNSERKNHEMERVLELSSVVLVLCWLSKCLLTYKPKCWTNRKMKVYKDFYCTGRHK